MGACTIWFTPLRLSHADNVITQFITARQKIKEKQSSVTFINARERDYQSSAWRRRCARRYAGEEVDLVPAEQMERPRDADDGLAELVERAVPAEQRQRVAVPDVNTRSMACRKPTFA